jgi:CRP-like cAMP-binding protein
MSDIQRKSQRKLNSLPHLRRPRSTAREPPVANGLLAGLSSLDQNELLASCERVHLQAGQLLYEPGTQIRCVYFPTSTFASLFSDSDRSAGVEVALIGAEGMWGVSGMLDIATAPFRLLVHGTGSAWRMEIGEFQRQLATRPTLSSRLARYLFVSMTDLAQMVTCTRYHLVEPRLARWLLMTGDRAHSPQFRLTQELLALVLGVRRAGITIAAGSLRQRGLISYHRGLISIRDRRGLERVSCSCYASARAAYARHLG